MKKLSSLLIVLLILLSACGQTVQSTPQDTTAAVTESEKIEYIDDLPSDLDFAGESINISCYDEECIGQLAPEQAGDIVDDAIYLRNMKVEERLNVKIHPMSVGSGFVNYLSALRKLLQSGDTTYDALYLIQYDFVPLAAEGMFLELHDAPYLDFDREWWADDYMSKMAVNNSDIYFLVGDYSASMINSMTSIYFNKDLYETVAGDPDDVYRVVLDGSWTLDRFQATIKGFYSDLDGDGVRTANDQYGSCYGESSSVSENFVMNMGGVFSYRDESGLPVIDPMGDDRVINCIDRVINLLGDESIYCYPLENYDGENDFRLGKIAFCFGDTGDTLNYRDMESQYGIIPYPKYDEEQAKQITVVRDAVMITALPSYCKKTEAVCATFEAMSAESYRSVIPVCYEIAMKTKYARDSLSSQMLDLMHDSIYTDFAYVNNYGFKSMVTMIRKIVERRSNTYASWYAKNESAIQKALDKMIKKAMG